MAKDPENKPAPAADPDEEFFKANGVESDDDKAYLKSAHLREKYLAHKRELEEKAKKGEQKKSRLFRRD